MVVAKSKTLFVIGKYDSESIQNSVGGNQNVGDCSASVAFATGVLNNAGA